jgi:hypothetical protein
VEFSRILRLVESSRILRCRVDISITDLISAVVELLERDISRLVVEVREALELVEL